MSIFCLIHQHLLNVDFNGFLSLSSPPLPLSFFSFLITSFPFSTTHPLSSMLLISPEFVNFLSSSFHLIYPKIVQFQISKNPFLWNEIAHIQKFLDNRYLSCFPKTLWEYNLLFSEVLLAYSSISQNFVEDERGTICGDNKCLQTENFYQIKINNNFSCVF